MMKWFRSPLLMATLSVARISAATWFVAPDGDDNASGTLAHPLATLQKAQDKAAPGDTVSLRGGIYQIEESQIASKQRIYARVISFDKSGEKGKPITYAAYQDEKPVFDFSGVRPNRMRVYAFAVSGSWLHFKGLEITGVQVTMTGHTQSICVESNGTHNVFEQLSLHDGQAIGIYHVRGSHNLFLNCDAWNNYDRTSENGRGGNVDGFGCHPSPGSVGNVFRGCRAWFNSDDGFDLISSHESVTIENCWALYNGYTPDFIRRGDGHGFKAGGYGSAPQDRIPKTIPRHIVRYCVAAKNKSSGFYANHHPGGIDWIHNSSYRHGINFLMLNRIPGTQIDIDGFDHKLFHNLSYATTRHLEKIDPARCELKNNSFAPDVKITRADFLSLDEKELLKPREKDGSLPRVQFLHPQTGSSINMGAF